MSVTICVTIATAAANLDSRFRGNDDLCVSHHPRDEPERLQPRSPDLRASVSPLRAVPGYFSPSFALRNDNPISANFRLISFSDTRPKFRAVVRSVSDITAKSPIVDTPSASMHFRLRTPSSSASIENRDGGIIAGEGGVADVGKRIGDTRPEQEFVSPCSFFQIEYRLARN